MSSSLTPQIQISEYIGAFETQAEAAERLGVSRQSFWDWRKGGKKTIPEPWCWKAKAVLDGISGGKGHGKPRR